MVKRGFCPCAKERSRRAEGAFGHLLSMGVWSKVSRRKSKRTRTLQQHIYPYVLMSLRTLTHRFFRVFARPPWPKGHKCQKSFSSEVMCSRQTMPTRSRIVTTNPKVPTMKVACSCCRFFSPKSPGHPRDECRRYSPAPRLAHDGRHDQFAIGIWPAVLPDHWCGDFKRRMALHQAVGVTTGTRVPR